MCIEANERQINNCNLNNKVFSHACRVRSEMAEKEEFLKQNVANKKSNAKLKKNVSRGTKNVTHAKRKKCTLHVQLMIPFCRPRNNLLKLPHFRYFRYYKHAIVLSTFRSN